MADFDVEARADAAEMLKPKASGGFGQTVTITSPGTSTYDPATGTSSQSGGAAQTGTGIEEDYESREIDGSLVKVGDKKFMLSPLKTDGTVLTMPEPGWTLTYAGGQVWRIEAVKPFSPAGVVVFAYLQLRGAPG